MTRLMDKNSGGSGEPAGYHSSIFDYDGDSGSSTMKRSRPYRNSLDYKLGSTNPSMYVIPPQPMTSGRSQHHDEYMQQQQQQAARKVMTRARGSSGIPPQHLTLEDLQNLDEETLMRVLNENPHLAQEAERIRQQHSSRGTGGTKMNRMTSSSSSAMMDRKYHRRADGTVHTEENSYIEELRKDGFPVIQWALVLLLIGGLAYQLYKSLKGPVKTKKSKKGKESITQKAIDRELERLAAEVDPSVKTKKSTNSAKKKPTPKKKASAKPKAAATPAAAADKSNGRVTKKTTSFDPAVPALTVSQAQVDQGEWQVVGKTVEKKKAVDGKEDVEVEETKNPKSDASTAPANGSTNDAPKDSTGKKEETPLDTNGGSAKEVASTKGPEAAPAANAGDGFTVSGKNKNKKKKKKSANTASSVANNTAPPATETPAKAGSTAVDDAALAKQLQSEEDNLAATDAGTKEVVWEEVVVKKKRSKA
eukprot:scaffold34621_cov166-Amphora_coffeaeformis.AAC.1